MKILKNFFMHFKAKRMPICLNKCQKGSIFGLEEMINNLRYNKSTVKCSSASGQILCISRDVFLNVMLPKT